MDLSTYLSEKGLTLKGFAIQLAEAGVQVSDVSVHRWVKNKARPSLRNAKAVERATDGKVTAVSLILGATEAV
jgi:DNA-binding transcriptional regulator YdaS (Cro superfamily)